MVLRSTRDHGPKVQGSESTQHRTVLITPDRPFHRGSSGAGPLGSWVMYLGDWQSVESRGRRSLATEGVGTDRSTLRPAHCDCSSCSLAMNRSPSGPSISYCTIFPDA